MTAHDDELFSLHQYYVKEYYMCAVGEKKQTIYPTCYTLTKGQRVHLFIDVIFQPNAERLVFIIYHRERERERLLSSRILISFVSPGITHHGALTGATCVPTAE
jgi:hypothetical protein